MTSEETDQGNERAPEAILKICGRAPAPARMCSGRFVECHCPAGHRYEVQAGMAGKRPELYQRTNASRTELR